MTPLDEVEGLTPSKLLVRPTSDLMAFRLTPTAGHRLGRYSYCQYIPCTSFRYPSLYRQENDRR